MEKIRIFFALLFATLSAYSQTDVAFQTKGLLKATSTISPGFMLNQSRTNIYLAGELEYFVEERVSFRGDGFWYVGSQQNPDLFKQNSAVYWGGFYHFRMNRSDLFIGLQPGISVTQPLVDEKYYYSDYGIRVCPQISFVAGYTCYVGKYFNFFANTRYVKGTYRNNTDIGLDELRICAGLGFNIHLVKREIVKQ
jgi:hypothetical protein